MLRWWAFAVGTFLISAGASPVAAQSSSAWTYEIFVNECKKAGGAVASSLDQYLRGERFVCQTGNLAGSRKSDLTQCEREAKQNVDWVTSLDSGAKAVFDRRVLLGDSPFEAVLFAQMHNPKVQALLKECRSWVETYLGAPGHTLVQNDCRCVSVRPANEKDFEGRATYFVSNTGSGCSTMSFTVGFVDATTSAGSTFSWASAGSITVGQTRRIQAPATFRIVSISAVELRNAASSHTCVCKKDICN